ncbi:MAG: oligosaccharide flippase family protein [Oscillospiraceae bacterium]
MENKEKSYSFLEGTAALMSATILAKIFGAAFKIPLASLLGGEGMGYYMAAYSIYGPISAVALSGMTMSISKLVAEFQSKRNGYMSKQVLKKAVLIYSVFGLSASSFLWFFSREITKMLGNSFACVCVMLIAPSLLFCSISAAFRGYYEGKSNMYPTAFSQVGESFARLVLGSLLAIWSARYSIKNPQQIIDFIASIVGETPTFQTATLAFSSSAAILGVTLSTIIGTIYIGLRYIIHDKNKIYCIKRECTDISKKLIITAIPICACTLISNIASLIDLATIVNRLNFAIAENPVFFLDKYSYIAKNYSDLVGLPIFLFGAYSGIAMTIFNIIPAFSATIGTTALPTIASSCKNDCSSRLSEKICGIIKYSAIIAFAGGIGVSVLSEKILLSLFPTRIDEVMAATDILRVLGIATIAIGILIPLNSIHQAMGNSFLTLKMMVLASIIKLSLNYILIAIPKLNVLGAAISTAISYSIILIFELIILSKNLKWKFNFYECLIKPLFCSTICGFTAFFSAKLLSGKLSNIIELTLVLLISAMIYLTFLLITGTIKVNIKIKYHLLSYF